MSALGTDIGLEHNVLHFWLLDQGDIWIDGDGEVHFITELDDDHLFNLLGFLQEQRGRLAFSLGVWRGIVQALARTRRPIQWSPTWLEQSLLWRTLIDEYGDRMGYRPDLGEAFLRGQEAGRRARPGTGEWQEWASPSAD